MIQVLYFDKISRDDSGLVQLYSLAPIITSILWKSKRDWNWATVLQPELPWSKMFFISEHEFHSL